MGKIMINNIEYGGGMPTLYSKDIVHNDGTSSNVKDALIRLNENVSNNSAIINTLDTNISNNRSLIDSNTNSISELNNINSELLKLNRICIGSQVLYPSLSGSGISTKTPFMGSYGSSLIGGIFDGITIPSGWHKEFRITYQAYNGGSGHIIIYLNNIKVSSIQTWSGDTFRIIGGSNFFKDSDVIQEPTYLYSDSHSGMNLYYESTTPSNWGVWNITLHGYLVKG